MKKLSKVLCIIFAFLIPLNSICVFADDDYSDNNYYDDTVMIGEYDSSEFGFVILYPENFDRRYTLPVLVWSGGSTNTPDAYDSIYRKFVDYGFIVITSTDNYLTDGSVPSKAIDYIIEENENEDSPLYQRVDTDCIGVAGHSLGGRNSINCARNDNRVKVAASIFGSNTDSERTNITTPSLFFGGELDDTISPDLWVKPMYEACGGPAVYVTVSNATHQDIYENADLYVYYIANWFYTWLYNDQELKEIFVYGGDMEYDISFSEYSSKNFETDYVYFSSDGTLKLRLNRNLAIVLASIIISMTMVGCTLILVFGIKKKQDNSKKA